MAEAKYGAGGRPVSIAPGPRTRDRALIPKMIVMSESSPATFPVTTALGLEGMTVERDLGLTFGLVEKVQGLIEIRTDRPPAMRVDASHGLYRLAFERLMKIDARLLPLTLDRPFGRLAHRRNLSE